MPKIDQIEYNKRIYTIMSWIVEGIQSCVIVQNIIAQNWTDAKKEKDKKRSAERMLKEARQRWCESEELELVEKRKIKVARLEQLSRELERTHKKTPAGIRTILAVEKEIIMIEGLRKSQKQIDEEQLAPVEVVARLTDSQFDKITKMINNAASGTS